MKILVAGGTGFLGKPLVKALEQRGHSVLMLTRNGEQINHIKWNPVENYIVDDPRLKEVEVIINLCGEGINDKRWSKRRKKELEDSRIGTNSFLFSQCHRFLRLKHFISASGITAYPFDNGLHRWQENESYGNSYIAQLVRRWEESADLFNSVVPVAKIRIAVVLSKDAGALPQLVSLSKKFLGSALGDGQQIMPWVTIDDLVELFIHVLNNQLEGVYNSNAGNISNAHLMKAINKQVGVNFSLPNVPSVIVDLLFGERGQLLVKGNSASNDKIIGTGFQFKYDRIEEALAKHIL